MNKELGGNVPHRTIAFVQLGATNHSPLERESNDYYATEPKAVELLLKHETFLPNIWEPACGEGHVSKVLEKYGYKVKSTDLIDRGYGQGGVDFLNQDTLFAVESLWNGDIVTNPPYKYAADFVLKSLNCIKQGNKVAMFLKIQFLESASRYAELFSKFPPKRIYVSSRRSNCAKNGEFEKYSSNAVCYCWYIWVKGYTGDPTIKWFNYGE